MNNAFREDGWRGAGGVFGSALTYGAASVGTGKLVGGLTRGAYARTATGKGAAARVGASQSAPRLTGNLNFTRTTASHMSDPARSIPVQTLRDAINTGNKIPDPRGTSANMFYTTMWKK